MTDEPRRIGKLEPVYSAIQPTHTVLLKCSADGTTVSTLATKLKPPGARKFVWVYPYGIPVCPRCGGSLGT